MRIGDFFLFKIISYICNMKKHWSKTKKVEFVLEKINKNQQIIQHLNKCSFSEREFRLLLPRMTHKELDYYYDKVINRYFI